MNLPRNLVGLFLRSRQLKCEYGKVYRWLAHAVFSRENDNVACELVTQDNLNFDMDFQLGGVDEELLGGDAGELGSTCISQASLPRITNKSLKAITFFFDSTNILDPFFRQHITNPGKGDDDSSLLVQQLLRFYRKCFHTAALTPLPSIKPYNFILSAASLSGP